MWVAYPRSPSRLALLGRQRSGVPRTCGAPARSPPQPGIDSDILASVLAREPEYADLPAAVSLLERGVALLSYNRAEEGRAFRGQRKHVGRADEERADAA